MESNELTLQSQTRFSPRVRSLSFRAHSQDLSRRTFVALLAAAFLLACLAHYYFYAHGVYAVSADESGHTIDAYLWAFDKSLPSDVWLPFYNIVVGTALKVFPDLFVTPRVISFLFGLLALGGLTWLAHELFHRPSITAATAFLGALQPERLVLSVVPLTEIMFISMIVIGCAFFARWILLKQPFSLIWAAFFFTISSSIRYEGWLFAVCLILTVMHRPSKTIMELSPRLYRRMAATALLVPVGWLLFHFAQSDRPLDFLFAPASNYSMVYGDSPSLLLKNSALAQFFIQNLRSWNIFGVIAALILFGRNIRMRVWLLLPGLSLLAMGVISIAGKALPNHSFWRVSAVWSILLVPFTAYWLMQQARVLLHREALIKPIVQIFAVVVLMAQFTIQAESLTSYIDFSLNERAAGEFLRKQLALPAARDNVLIETSSWQYLHILIASQRPGNFVFNSGRDPSHPVRSIINAIRPVDPTTLSGMGIRYLLFKEPTIKASLDHARALEPVRSFGQWTLYELRQTER